MTDSQHEVERLSDESLLQRLDAIAKHDWRVSFLAHTSDTAAEAAARLRLATEIVPADSPLEALRRYLVTRTEFTVAQLRAHLGDGFTKKAVYNAINYLAHGGTPHIEQVAYGRYRRVDINRKPTPEGK